jgi:hypothetical protein
LVTTLLTVLGVGLGVGVVLLHLVGGHLSRNILAEFHGANPLRTDLERIEVVDAAAATTRQTLDRLRARASIAALASPFGDEAALARGSIERQFCSLHLDEDACSVAIAALGRVDGGADGVEAARSLAWLYEHLHACGDPRHTVEVDFDRWQVALSAWSEGATGLDAAKAWRSQGRLATARGQPDAAVEHFARSTKLALLAGTDPASGRTLALKNARSIGRLSCGKALPAADTFAAADPGALAWTACGMLRQDQPKLAQELLGQALSASPADGDPRGEGGDCGLPASVRARLTTLITATRRAGADPARLPACIPEVIYPLPGEE